MSGRNHFLDARQYRDTKLHRSARTRCVRAKRILLAMCNSMHRSLSQSWLKTVVLQVGLAIAPAIAFGHGAVDVRISALTADVAKDPKNAALHFDLAAAHLEHEDWESARRELTQVDALASGQYPTALILGRVEIGAGKPQEAVVALNRFLEAHPGDPRALLLRARANKSLEKSDASVDDYRAALASDPHPEPDLFQEFADTLASIGRNDEALEVLSRGMDRLGQLPSLAIRALDLETKSGRYDAALARVDAMQKAAPRPESWMSRRADILTRAGRTTDARAAWNALLAHIAALPEAARASHAISLIAETARRGLASLDASASEPSAAPVKTTQN